MRNEEVIKGFVFGGNVGKGNSVFSKGNKLFSYDTIIAERIDGKVYVNETKYSVTTSKAQGYLRYWLKGGGIKVESYVPIGTHSLAHYITKK